MIDVELLSTSLIVVLIPGASVVFTVSSGLVQGHAASATWTDRSALAVQGVSCKGWLRRSFAAAFAGLGAQLVSSKR